MRVRRKVALSQRLVRNPGYGPWPDGTLNIRDGWEFQEDLNYVGECPQFWLDYGNNRPLDHVHPRVLMLAVRYREFMPPIIMYEVDQYLQFRGWTEEWQAWADRIPTPLEVAYVS